MQIDLSGKIAVITGGGGQLGRVMARTLASCGADVAIHYLRNESRAMELAEEIQAKWGVRTCVVSGDVAKEADVFAMRDKIGAELGSPDIVVNSAVAQYGWTTVLEQAVADYESQFQSCVLQNVLMAKAFVPAMREKRWGRIIAINTECAMTNAATTSAYVSGKRGMDGVLRVLAREIGEYNITVNQVAPGWTISDNDRKNGTEKNEIYDKQVPLGHRGEDQDIANAVAFLASDLASFITGVYLPVSGGTVMPAI